MSHIAMRAVPAAAAIAIGAAVCGLGLSGSAAAAPLPQNAEFVVTQAAAADGTGSNANDTHRSGAWAVSRANPPEPTSIKIEKSAAPRIYLRAGQKILYTYRVTNTGRSLTLHAITVSDDRIHRPVHCLVTILAPGKSTVCAAVYTITQHDMDAGHVTNVAVATGKLPIAGVVRSKPAEETIHALQHAALRIHKTASVYSYDAAGLPVTYYYRVTNTGNVTLRHVQVTDSQGLTVFCWRRTLAPRRWMTCTSYYRTTEADVAARHIRNVGYAVGQPPHGRKVHASDRLVIRLKYRPAISIVKTASVDSFAAAGTPVIYYYLVTNEGNVTLRHVRVSDSRGLTVSCPDASLALDEAMTCTASYVTSQADVDAGTLANTGSVTGRAPHGRHVSADAALTIPAVQAPEIGIVKTASVASFTAPGQQVTYYYLVTNNGNVTLHGVTVTDSRGLTLSCPHTTLTVGQAMTCTASYVTTLEDVVAGGIPNTGTVTGKTPAGTEVMDAAPAFLPFTGSPFVPVTG